MEKNLKNIVYISRKNEKKNRDFRAALKFKNLPDKKIDSIVNELNEKFSSEIDCKTCANCCARISPILRNDDIDQISKLLRIKPSVFIKTYLYEDEDKDLVFKDSPCPFLKNNECSIYEDRPSDCKSYPHLHKKRFISNLMSVIHNCSICPIVFNVYEELKKNPLIKSIIKDY